MCRRPATADPGHRGPDLGARPVMTRETEDVADPDRLRRRDRFLTAEAAVATPRNATRGPRMRRRAPDGALESPHRDVRTPGP